jgi:hypothetical protein
VKGQGLTQIARRCCILATELYSIYILDMDVVLFVNRYCFVIQRLTLRKIMRVLLVYTIVYLYKKNISSTLETIVLTVIMNEQKIN